MSENSLSNRTSSSKRSYECMNAADIFEDVERRILRLIKNSNGEDHALKYIDLDCSERFELSGLDAVQMRVLHSLCMESVRDLRMRENIPSRIFKFACESVETFGNKKLAGSNIGNSSSTLCHLTD